MLDIGMFALRIVTVDHYQSRPLGAVDVGYSEFRSSEVKQVPVIRVFGATPAGQKTCLHLHGAFPYIYVPYDGTQPEDQYLHQFAVSLDKAINITLAKPSSFAQHVYKVTVVCGIPFYGYHSTERHFLKIYFYNPSMIKRAIELLQNGAVMNKSFQPHEAHIPFIMQTFIDYNLYGMNMLNASKVKFRRGKCRFSNTFKGQSLSPLLSTTRRHSTESVGSSSLVNSRIHQAWNEETIPSDLYLPEEVERQSICELEVDVMSCDILNRRELMSNPGINPGLKAIWEDERHRRRKRGESSQLTPLSSQDREDVASYESEAFYKQQLLQKLTNVVVGKPESDENTLSSSSSSYIQASQTLDQEASLNSQVPSEASEPVIDEVLANSLSQSFNSSLNLSQTNILDSQDEALIQLVMGGQQSKPFPAGEEDSILSLLPRTVAAGYSDDELQNDDKDALDMSQQIWNTECVQEDGHDGSLSSDEELLPQVDGPNDPKPQSSGTSRSSRCRLGPHGRTLTARKSTGNSYRGPPDVYDTPGHHYYRTVTHVSYSAGGVYQPYPPPPPTLPDPWSYRNYNLWNSNPAHGLELAPCSSVKQTPAHMNVPGSHWPPKHPPLSLGENSAMDASNPFSDIMPSTYNNHSPFSQEMALQQGFGSYPSQLPYYNPPVQRTNVVGPICDYPSAEEPCKGLQAQRALLPTPQPLSSTGYTCVELGSDNASKNYISLQRISSAAKDYQEIWPNDGTKDNTESAQFTTESSGYDDCLLQESYSSSSNNYVASNFEPSDMSSSVTKSKLDTVVTSACNLLYNEFQCEPISPAPTAVASPVSESALLAMPSSESTTVQCLTSAATTVSNVGNWNNSWNCETNILTPLGNSQIEESIEANEVVCTAALSGCAMSSDLDVVSKDEDVEDAQGEEATNDSRQISIGSLVCDIITSGNHIEDEEGKCDNMSITVEDSEHHEVHNSDTVPVMTEMHESFDCHCEAGLDEGNVLIQSMSPSQIPLSLATVEVETASRFMQRIPVLEKMASFVKTALHQINTDRSSTNSLSTSSPYSMASDSPVSMTSASGSPFSRSSENSSPLDLCQNQRDSPCSELHRTWNSQTHIMSNLHYDQFSQETRPKGRPATRGRGRPPRRGNIRRSLPTSPEAHGAPPVRRRGRPPSNACINRPFDLSKATYIQSCSDMPQANMKLMRHVGTNVHPGELLPRKPQGYYGIKYGDLKVFVPRYVRLVSLLKLGREKLSMPRLESQLSNPECVAPWVGRITKELKRLQHNFNTKSHLSNSTVLPGTVETNFKTKIRLLLPPLLSSSKSYMESRTWMLHPQTPQKGLKIRLRSCDNCPDEMQAQGAHDGFINNIVESANTEQSKLQNTKLAEKKIEDPSHIENVNRCLDDISKRLSDVSKMHSNVTESPLNAPEMQPDVTEMPPVVTKMPPVVTKMPPVVTKMPPNMTKTLPAVTETPPDATETPPDATETPPDATETPPDATETPPDATETPPGATEMPPGATETPPAATETPPAATETPPAATEKPPEATETPPEATETPPEATETPPEETETPPEATETPPEATETPPEATETPPDATETPPEATETPPEATETPPDATETSPDATETPPDATETPPDATETLPDATETPPDVNEILSAATKTLPDVSERTPDVSGAPVLFNHTDASSKATELLSDANVSLCNSPSNTSKIFSSDVEIPADETDSLTRDMSNLNVVKLSLECTNTVLQQPITSSPPLKSTQLVPIAPPEVVNETKRTTDYSLLVDDTRTPLAECTSGSSTPVADNTEKLQPNSVNGCQMRTVCNRSRRHKVDYNPHAFTHIWNYDQIVVGNGRARGGTSRRSRGRVGTKFKGCRSLHVDLTRLPISFSPTNDKDEFNYLTAATSAQRKYSKLSLKRTKTTNWQRCVAVIQTSKSWLSDPVVLVKKSKLIRSRDRTILPQATSTPLREPLENSLSKVLVHETDRKPVKYELRKSRKSILPVTSISEAEFIEQTSLSKTSPHLHLRKRRAAYVTRRPASTRKTQTQKERKLQYSSEECWSVLPEETNLPAKIKKLKIRRNAFMKKENEKFNSNTYYNDDDDDFANHRVNISVPKPMHSKPPCKKLYEKNKKRTTDFVESPLISRNVDVTELSNCASDVSSIGDIVIQNETDGFEDTNSSESKASSYFGSPPQLQPEVLNEDDEDIKLRRSDLPPLLLEEEEELQFDSAEERKEDMGSDNEGLEESLLLSDLSDDDIPQKSESDSIFPSSAETSFCNSNELNIRIESVYSSSVEKFDRLSPCPSSTSDDEETLENSKLRRTLDFSDTTLPVLCNMNEEKDEFRSKDVVISGEVCVASKTTRILPFCGVTQNNNSQVTRVRVSPGRDDSEEKTNEPEICIDEINNSQDLFPSSFEVPPSLMPLNSDGVKGYNKKLKYLPALGSNKLRRSLSEGDIRFSFQNNSKKVCVDSEASKNVDFLKKHASFDCLLDYMREGRKLPLNKHLQHILLYSKKSDVSNVFQTFYPHIKPKEIHNQRTDVSISPQSPQAEDEVLVDPSPPSVEGNISDATENTSLAKSVGCDSKSDVKNVSYYDQERDLFGSDSSSSECEMEIDEKCSVSSDYSKNSRIPNNKNHSQVRDVSQNSERIKNVVSPVSGESSSDDLTPGQRIEHQQLDSDAELLENTQLNCNSSNFSIYSAVRKDKESRDLNELNSSKKIERVESPMNCDLSSDNLTPGQQSERQPSGSDSDLGDNSLVDCTDFDSSVSDCSRSATLLKNKSLRIVRDASLHDNDNIQNLRSVTTCKLSSDDYVPDQKIKLQSDSDSELFENTQADSAGFDCKSSDCSGNLLVDKNTPDMEDSSINSVDSCDDLTPGQRIVHNLSETSEIAHIHCKNLDCTMHSSSLTSLGLAEEANNELTSVDHISLNTQHSACESSDKLSLNQQAIGHQDNAMDTIVLGGVLTSCPSTDDVCGLGTAKSSECELAVGKSELSVSQLNKDTPKRNQAEHSSSNSVADTVNDCHSFIASLCSGDDSSTMDDSSPSAESVVPSSVLCDNKQSVETKAMSLLVMGPKKDSQLLNECSDTSGTLSSGISNLSDDVSSDSSLGLGESTVVTIKQSDTLDNLQQKDCVSEEIKHEQQTEKKALTVVSGEECVVSSLWNVESVMNLISESVMCEQDIAKDAAIDGVLGPAEDAAYSSPVDCNDTKDLEYDEVKTTITFILQTIEEKETDTVPHAQQQQFPIMNNAIQSKLSEEKTRTPTKTALIAALEPNINAEQTKRLLAHDKKCHLENSECNNAKTLTAASSCAGDKANIDNEPTRSSLEASDLENFYEDISSDSLESHIANDSLVGKDGNTSDGGMPADKGNNPERPRNKIYTFIRPPPTREEIWETLKKYHIPESRHQKAYYSNHNDELDHAAHGQMCNRLVCSSRVTDLPESTGKFHACGLENWRLILATQSQEGANLSCVNLVNELRLQGHMRSGLIVGPQRSIVLTPCLPPPCLSDIKQWLQQCAFIKETNRKDTNDSNEEPSGSFSEVLLTKQCAEPSQDSGDTRVKNVRENNTRITTVTHDLSSPVASIQTRVTSPPKLESDNIQPEHSTPSLSRASVSFPPLPCTPILKRTPESAIDRVCRLLIKKQALEKIEEEAVATKQSRPTGGRQKGKRLRMDQEDGPSTTKRPRRRSLEERHKSQMDRPNTPLYKQLLTTQLQNQFTDFRGRVSPASQLDGPTPNNSYAFKVSCENLQDVKAMHEHQFLTTMSAELHIRTRQDLHPDPAVDPICAVFYSIHCDMPDNRHICRDVTGAIVLDRESWELQNHCKRRTLHPDSCTPKEGRGIVCSVHFGEQGQESVTKSPDSSKQSCQCQVAKRHLLERAGVVDLDVTYVPSEISLLEEMVQLTHKWDPDILVGYEIEMLSWGYLLQRGAALEINLQSSLSRLLEPNPLVTAGEREEMEPEIVIKGRIVLNLWRLMRTEAALTSYSFENVAYHILHQRIPSFSFRMLTKWFDHTTDLYRSRTVKHYITRVKALLQLVEQLDLVGRTSELARLFGIQFYEVLSRGSQFRVESMMLRMAKPLNFVACSPSIDQRARMRAPECLALIMEPESKFYSDPVVVLDFQSLYPSMMIAYNYCYSTCLGKIDSLGQNEPFDFGCTSLCLEPSLLKELAAHINISPVGVAFVKPNIRKGVLPRMLQEILETRIMVKKAMKDYKRDKALTRVLDARQMGLKLIANVTYGYTSANFSGRMPCVEVGDSVVSKARETLERAIQLVKDTPSWEADVVYGDTDSMFIHLPGRSKEEAFRIGQEIADAVTAINPKPVKLKFEKVYLPCVLQTKKRYVGNMYETADQKEPTFDAKGIETVRRDGCPAVVKVLEKSLKILFSTRDVSQVKAYVQSQLHKLLIGRVSLQDYTFAREYRGLTGYKPAARVPALEIAKRIVQVDRRREPRVGERVPYVIVYGSPGEPLFQLVRQPQEVMTDENLRLNCHYYISSVILPPLDRIFKLMNVNVNQWYAKLPRPLERCQGNNRQGTIAKYFTRLSCSVCNNPSESRICSGCRNDPQGSVVILTQKVNRMEQCHQHLSEICRSCTGMRDVQLSCISLDCPVFYRLAQASRDLQQVPHLKDFCTQMAEF